jgi:hypothetical protein
MPRATAASTMEPVEGPRRSSSSSSRSSATALSASKAVVPARPDQGFALKASRPGSSVLDHHLEGAGSTVAWCG